MRKALLAIFMAFVIVLAGCGSQNSDSVPSPTPAEYTARENISFYLTTKENLNPLYADTENDIAVFSLLYDSLIYLEKDMTITPQLAESCTVSADSTSISFILRDDVFWHDGEKFTAEDVKYTIDTIKNPETKSTYYDSLTAVSEVNVVDDYNFTLTLTGPYARIVNLLDFPIIPAHDASIDKTPMGTGRYKFLENHKSGGMILTKNNIWPLGDLPIEEKVIIRMLGKSTDEFSLFKTGEIDVLNVNAAQMSEFGFADKSAYNSYITSKYEFIGFNLSNLVFSDPNVRKAVSAAINRDEIVKSAYLGLATAVNSPILPTAYFYNLDADNAVYSIEKSKEYLTESGWSDNNGDGVMEKNIDGIVYTLEGTLLVNNDNPLRVTASDQICRMLSAAGFKITAKPVDWDTYQNSIYSDEYSLFFGGIELSPGFDYSFFLSSWAIENGQNFMNYSSGDMDSAITKTHTAVSMDECKSTYLEFQYIFTRDLPVVGLLFQNNSLIYQDNISGVSEPCFSKPLKDVNRWRQEK